MSAGASYNQVCYPSQSEALAAACSAIHSTSGDGSATDCVGLVDSGSSSVGGTYSGKLRVQLTQTDNSTVVVQRSVTVLGCERYDYEYWSPVIGAWVAALVAIVAARVLYTRVFSRETL